MKTFDRSVCIVLLSVFAFMPASDVKAQGLFQQAPRTEDVFLLAPRPLVRLLREGEQAIQEGRYTDGIVALATLLQDNAKEIPEDLRGQDFFLGPMVDQLYNRTVKGEASRFLSELPAEGRKVLEIELGVAARRELDSALADRSLIAVGEVARRFPHTEAAYDAELITSNSRLASGFPLAAARGFESLLASPAARTRFGVELAKAAAVSWMHARKPELATIVLESAATYFPSGSVSIGGKQYSLSQTEDWSAVLTGALEFEQSRVSDREAENWQLSGGSSSRNATVRASMPLRNARWVKEIHSSVPEKKSLLALSDSEQQAARVLLPKFEVRTLGDLVFTKTSDASVLAIDFETGLTKWPFYQNSTPARLRGIQLDMTPRQGPGRLSDDLVNRIWGSSAFGRFSCDNERLYYIADETTTSNRFRGGIPTVETNVLKGVSISGQGKMLWAVGGNSERTNEPWLRNAYFLGPPVSHQGELYAMVVRKRSETCLVSLDPNSGKLRWYQQLAHPSFNQLQYDPLRRSQALSPTISEGVILCPTGAGAVVAVDLSSRQLLWGLVYELTENRRRSQFQRGRGGAFSFSNTNYKPLDARWHDPGMIAQGGVVAISPVESDSFFCRRIDTGEPVFAGELRRNARYVAGIRDENVYIVSEREAYCLNMAESDIRWIADFPDDQKLAGKGLWMSDSIMIPLTGNKLIRLSLDDGALMSEASVDQPLGNLFVHKGQLISASPTSVAIYYMRYDLETEVAERLDNDPTDTWALNQSSQLLLSSEGQDIDRAYQLLSKSYELDPDNIDTRYLLVDALLAGMEKDFPSFEARATAMRDVVEFGPQRFQFLQWLALGSLKTGKRTEAFGHFMDLMRERLGVIRSSIDSRASDLQLGPLHTVDADNWIATELARLFEQSNSAEQQSMAESIKKEIASLASYDTGRRRQTLQYFRWHPSAGDEILADAIKLLERDDQTRAEQALLPLLQAGDSRVQEVARKLIARRTITDNLRFGPRGQAFASLYQTTQEQNGLEAVIDEQNIPDEFMKPINWNEGSVAAKVELGGSRRYPQGLRLPMISERFGRPRFDVKLAGGTLVVANMNGEPITRFDFNRASSDINDEYAKATVRGGLIIVETSSELVGMDLYRGLNDGRDAILWRQSLLYPNASPRRQFRQPILPSSDENIFGAPVAERKTGSRKTHVGPLTPAGLVLQLGNSVVLIDAYSGRKLWQRHGYDDLIRLAAGQMSVAVVNPSLAQVEILDCRDGTLIETREYSGDWRAWHNYQEMLVEFKTQQSQSDATAVRSSKTRQPILRIWNALDGHDLVPPLALARGSRGNICEGRYLVVLEPGIGLHYVDLDEQLYVKHDVPTDLDIKNVNLALFGKTLVVLTNADDGANTIIPQNERIMHTPINGMVHAIDTETRQLVWERPGRLNMMMLPKSQPRNSPFMVTYRRDSVRGANNAAFEVADALAVVDLRSGRIAYSNQDVQLGRSSGFAMMLYPRSQSIDFTLGRANFLLTATTGPRPPQPIFSYGLKNKARRSQMRILR